MGRRRRWRPWPPLTAVYPNTPAGHDGEAAITFKPRFSEEFPLSYQALQERSAFSMTGGIITYCKRLEPGSNLRRDIHVKPDGNGGVTMAPPVATDCGAQGAISAEEDRKLSHRNVLTVGGPGGSPPPL